MEGKGYTEAEILAMAEKISQNKKEDLAFKNSLARFFDEKQENINNLITIGVTPNVLVAAGANGNLLLAIEPKTILKCIGNPEEVHHGHGLSQKHLEQLVRELRMPALVLKGSHEHSLVAVTELKDKENCGVIISIQLDSHRDWQLVNRISSAYGKGNFADYLDRQLNKEKKLIAYNEEKADKLLRPLGLQLPPGKQIICFDNSIAYSTESIKHQKMENKQKKSEREGRRKSKSLLGNLAVKNKKKQKKNSNNDPDTMGR